MKFRYNIAKVCATCGKGFITDMFEEADVCNKCNSSESSYEADEEIRQEIDMLINPYGYRSKAHFYD